MRVHAVRVPLLCARAGGTRIILVPPHFLPAFPGLPVSDFRRLGPRNIVDGLVVLRIRKRIRVGNGSVTSCKPRELKAVLIRHEKSRAENEPGSNCWQRWLRSKKEWQYGGWGAAAGRYAWRSINSFRPIRPAGRSQPTFKRSKMFRWPLFPIRSDMAGSLWRCAALGRMRQWMPLCWSQAASSPSVRMPGCRPVRL